MRPVILAALLVVAACTPQPGAGQHRVTGRAVAGPTCPVEPASPGAGRCEPRPVAGATLIINDASGMRKATVVTDDNGSWQVSLAEGSYTVEPQPREGMMGTAPPIDFTVDDHQPAELLVVEYDTGIR